jgi:hypothetical protein
MGWGLSFVADGRLLVLLAGIGCFPLAFAQAQRKISAVNIPSPEPIPEDAPAAPVGSAVVPMRAFAKRLFVPVVINEKYDCLALLDTGAENSLLNQARVKIPNLRMGGARELYGATVGMVRGVEAELDSPAIGERSAKRFRILIVNHAPAGNEFMSNFDLLLGTAPDRVSRGPAQAPRHVRPDKGF